jgi:hypothetical protein
MRTKTTLFFFLFTILVFKGFSQFSLDAELRPRFEYRFGYKTLPDSTSSYAALVTQRSRIIANYKNEKLQLRFSLQDVRTWGDEKMKTDIAGIGLHEAWVELKLFDSISSKIGKQEFLYDNQRLLDIGNWSQIGTTHNALLLKYKYNSWTVHLAMAYNQVLDTNFTTNYSKTDVKDNYKTLNFLWISKQIKKLNVSGLLIADGFQKPKTINTTYLRYTAGPILKLNLNKFNSELRGFYQGGKSQTGKDINSWFANGEVSYKILNPLSVKLGGEIWSGYNFTDSTSKEVNSFDLLYGSSHKFNGSMDYFTKPSDTKNAGLVDIYTQISCKQGKKSTYRLDYHYFGLENKYGKKNAIPLDKYLGSEIDLLGKYALSKEISLEIGYSCMLASKTMEKIKGGSSDYFANWAYVMLTVKPTLFTNK